MEQNDSEYEVVLRDIQSGLLVSCLTVATDLVRDYPILDLLWLLGTLGPMYHSWRKAGYDPREENEQKRQAGATVITNQITAAMTAVSIVVAGVGAVLAIGLGKDFPPTPLVHLVYAAGWGLFSIFVGLYTLGYISSPSVFLKFDVTKRSFVQLAAFVQLNSFLLSAVRFGVGLWDLSRHI